MSIAQQLAAFNTRLRRKVNVLPVQAVDEVFRSIVYGSEITTAPGQPVDKGTLRDSWVREEVEPGIERITSTDNPLKVASIENNWRGATLKSSVGGFHSVAITRLGFNRIVEVVNERLG
jgi:hypothetical protein